MESQICPTRITLVPPTFHAVGRAQNALAHPALLRYPRDRVCVGSVPNQDDQSQGEYQEVADLQDVRVLQVGQGSAELWIPTKLFPQVVWYSDHGGIVLATIRPGDIQQPIPAGGAAG